MSDFGFIRHFHACNKCDLKNFVPFYIGEKKLGWITKKFAQTLNADEGFVTHDDDLALSPALNTFEKRSTALAYALSKIPSLKIRNEMYPVIAEWGDEPLAQIDRAGVPVFGVRGFGIHVNGFVRKPDGIYLWIGERAKDRQADPGKLDNMIGGGQPIGLTLEQNLAKEAFEEAGLDAALAATARPVSTLRYMLERQGGLRNDTLFVYDLEMPPEVTPRNTDGEVAAFHLLPLPQVAEIIRTSDRFKFNCNLVIIDFMVRHERLSAKERECNEINELLHKYGNKRKALGF